MRHWCSKQLLICILSFVLLLPFLAKEHQNRSTCKWPPEGPASMPFKGIFNLTIYVRSNGDSASIHHPNTAWQSCFEYLRRKKKSLFPSTTLWSSLLKCGKRLGAQKYIAPILRMCRWRASWRELRGERLWIMSVDHSICSLQMDNFHGRA